MMCRHGVLHLLQDASDLPALWSFELSGFIKVETRGEQGCIEEQPDEVLDSLVTLVGRRLLQLRHDRVLWVDLHGLLGNHVGELWNCHEEPEPS